MIPEHSPLEVQGESPSQPPAHVHDAHGPGAEEVVLACLTQRLPCPVCGRTEACRCMPPKDYSATAHRARLVVEALRIYHLLPAEVEEGAEPVFDAEETARWLADRSGFARYTQVEDGWKRLLQSDRDVELASIYAAQRVPSSDAEMVKAAKAALLGYHQGKAAAASHEPRPPV